MNDTDAYVTCRDQLFQLLSTSKEIMRCTQGDVLGFSRLADLQANQVQQMRKVESLMKSIGESSYTDPTFRQIIDQVEELQARIDYNLKIHAHLMREEITQLRAAKSKVNSLNETYKIKFKRSDNKFDTRS